MPWKVETSWANKIDYGLVMKNNSEPLLFANLVERSSTQPKDGNILRIDMYMPSKNNS
jgi:hypothetical protein